MTLAHSGPSAENFLRILYLLNQSAPDHAWDVLREAFSDLPDSWEGLLCAACCSLVCLAQGLAHGRCLKNVC